MMQFLTEVVFKELDAKSAASSVSLTVKRAFIVLQGKKREFLAAASDKVQTFCLCMQASTSHRSAD